MKEIHGNALDGVRVLEFGTGYVGPVLTMRLAEMGADVIKIESKQRPDFMRGKFIEGEQLSPSFLDVNRGKKSVLINAKHPRGHALVLRLANQTDLVVENFGAGVMNRLGLDFEALKAVKPDIVMISLQGLGATVTHSVTLGQNIPPLIGLTYLWNHAPGLRPVGSQLFHPDYFAGVYGACIALAALDDRRRTGRGHYIDAAQAEAAASLLGPFYLASSVDGQSIEPSGNRTHPGAPAGCYRCQGEDTWCFIIVKNDRDWEKFKEALGHPRWSEDDRFQTIIGRLRHREELDRLIESWTRAAPAPRVMETLQSRGVACGVVQDAEDLMEDPQLIQQNFITRVSQPGMGEVKAGGSPVKYSDLRVDCTKPAPLFGQHTRLVMEEYLRLPRDEIDQLEQEGVLT